MTPVERIRLIVTKNNLPRFFVGNNIEFTEEFSLLDENKSNDGTKYPCILMDSQFVEEKGKEKGVLSIFKGTFYFVYPSKLEYTKEQRIANIYNIYIYPMEQNFLKALFRSTNFVFDDDININKLDYITRTSEEIDKAKNKLNDVIDVLKIELELKLRN